MQLLDHILGLSVENTSIGVELRVGEALAPVILEGLLLLFLALPAVVAPCCVPFRHLSELPA